MACETFLIVTAYNEADRIGATLAALARVFPGAPTWLADDGSADGTSQIAREAGARVVRSERVIGKGGAATLAAREALRDARAQRGADEHEVLFVLCDADLGDSAGQLDALAQTVRRGEADLAVAVFTRRRGGGLGIAVGFARWAIQRRCGVRMSAPVSGQRALRARVLADVLPFARGFGMELGMTIDALHAGYRVVEVELDLAHRASGRTPAGFAHRASQLADFVRAYVPRRQARIPR